MQCILSNNVSSCAELTLHASLQLQLKTVLEIKTCSAKDKVERKHVTIKDENLWKISGVDSWPQTGRDVAWSCQDALLHSTLATDVVFLPPVVGIPYESKTKLISHNQLTHAQTSIY